jgi:hypothetical protein
VLTRGYVTFVSPEDAHHLKRRKWHATARGRIICAQGYPYLALHREVTGGASRGDIDHKDHDGTNNCRKNLRSCLHSQNLSNGRYRSGPSGFRGVYLEKRTGHWCARITDRWLGTFPTPEEAAHAYDAAALGRFGEFATVNFPRRKQ